MKRIDIASQLARQRKISRARAADCVDRVIHDILRRLRRGQVAELPGLGQLHPGKPVRFRRPRAASKTGTRNQER